MDLEVKHLIEQLSGLPPKLNHAIKTASAVVQAVEKFLNECGICILVDQLVSQTTPVAVSLEDDHDRNRDSWESLYLSYRLVGSSYQIAVVNRTLSGETDVYESYCTDERVESERVTPWSAALRDEKLETFPALPKLLKEIALQMTKSLVAVEASIDESIAMMPALRRTEQKLNADPTNESKHCLTTLSN